jgi:hypothetical protein
MLAHSQSQKISSGPSKARALSGRLRPTSNTRRLAWRRGVAATEFAIVAPVFFLMVVGFLEFGQAITTGASTGEVISAVEDYTAGVTVAGVDVSVSPDPGSAAPGTAITVTTSVPFSDVSWMTSPWFLGSKTLTASSQMRKEGFE